MACIITYKGKKYSYEEFASHLHDGELNQLVKDGIVSGLKGDGTGVVDGVKTETPKESKSDTKELDYLANNVPNSGEVGKYLSGESIEDATGEAPRNDQKIIGQKLTIALDHSQKFIEKAKETFGEYYIEKTLDYVNNSTASVSNKALMYMSLENAVGKEKLLHPENEGDLNKLQDLIYEQSQAYLREMSLALNYAKLRNIAKVGYDMSQVVAHFFSPEEKTARVKIEKAVDAKIEKIQEEYEQLLEKNEELQKQNEALQEQVLKNSADKVKIRQRRLKLADKLDKIAENIDNFGRINDPDIKRNSLAPDVQKFVAEAIRYVAEEIRSDKEIPKAILDAAKKFANDKLKPDFLKAQIEQSLKDAGFTQEEISKNSLQDESTVYIENGKIKIPKKILIKYSEQGVSDINELVTKLKEDYKDVLGEYTDRQVRDAVTNYGQIKEPNNDPAATNLRRMTRIGRIISGLEDVAEKKRPLRSGLQRDKLEVEERNMLKQLREEMKKLPIDEVTKSNQLKTQLDAYKRRVENRIEELRDAIEKKQPLVKKEKVELTDTDLENMIQEKEKWQSVYNEMFGERPLTEGEKIIKRLENELDRIINKLETKKKEKEPVTEDEQNTINDLKDRIYDEKVKVGLIRSKEQKAEEETLTPDGKFEVATGKSVKDFVTDILIKKGYGKTTTIKGEKKQILDWKKLVGSAKSITKLSKIVGEELQKYNLLKEDIEYAKDLFVQHYIDIHSSLIDKSLTELKRKNKYVESSGQRSAARKLAELYSLGLFDKTEREFDNALNKAAGINLTEKNYEAAKDIAKALETVYATSFKGARLDDLTAKQAIDNINDKLRLLLIDETSKQGNWALRAANAVRTYFDIAQTMILNSMKQAAENPLSGLEANAIESITNAISKEGNGGKEVAKQRNNVLKKIFKDMVLQGGTGYGDVENLFVNREHLDDYINKGGDNKIYHGIMSVVTGKLTLNTMDAMFKFSITEKKFANNLIKILTHETNQNKMSKDEAVKFVAEHLTGQTLKDARETAKEIIEKVNKDAGRELVPNTPESVERFANDIVKSSLEMGGKITSDQIKAAYNAAYKNAGLNIGHVANNFLSKMVQGYSSQLENKITQAIKNKEWNKAAGYTLQSIIFRNIINPFVGGGTNWLVLRLDKAGLGLFTGLAYHTFDGKNARIDLSTEEGVKKLEKNLYSQARIKDSYMRGAVGGGVTALLYLLYKSLDDKKQEEYRKWRGNHQYVTRYSDIITPESILLEVSAKNKRLPYYFGSLMNKNDYMDASTKLLNSAKYYQEGKYEKAKGALGEAIGSKINTPLPWRLVKDNYVIYQGVTGKDPYHGDYTPSQGFWNGVFQGGAIEFVGLRPAKNEEPNNKKKNKPQTYSP